MNQETQAQNYSDDEIDLFELIETLWKEKLTIFGLTLLFAFGGVGYALLATPIYEVEQRLSAPKVGQLVELQKYSGAPDQNQVFERVQKIVTSQEFRQELLKLPLYRGIFEPEQTQGQRLRALDGLIKAVLPSKSVKDITIVVTYHDPELAVDLLSAAINLLEVKTRASFEEDISLSISSRVDRLNQRMLAVSNKYSSDLEAELARLNDALSVAKAANIVEPIDSSELLREPSSSGEVSIVNELRGLYRLGTRLLEAEVNALKSRDLNNALLIPGLSKLQSEIEELNTIKINYNDFSPFWIGGEILIPERPVKPKKTLIVALAVVLGGMLGVVFVLIRQAVRNRK